MLDIPSDLAADLNPPFDQLDHTITAFELDLITFDQARQLLADRYANSLALYAAGLDLQCAQWLLRTAITDDLGHAAADL